MKNILLCLVLLPLSAQAANNAPDKLDMPHQEMPQWMLMADQLEWRNAQEGDVYAWDAGAWYGYDLNKVLLRSEGEMLNGETEKAEVRLAWDHAVAPYWNLLLGARHDIRPDAPQRDWAFVGVRGTAPYFVHTDAKLFVGEDSLVALRLTAEYELLLTQRLVLTPKLEANVYTREDRQHDINDGLSDVSAGLRLKYEIVRQFAPYVGVHWEKGYGITANREDAMLVLGINAWY